MTLGSAAAPACRHATKKPKVFQRLAICQSRLTKVTIAAQHNLALCRLASLPCQIVYGCPLDPCPARRARSAESCTTPFSSCGPACKPWPDYGQRPPGAAQMMPNLLRTREVWFRLRELDDRHQYLSVPLRTRFRIRAADYEEPRARVRCVWMALEKSKDRACSMLVERLSGISSGMCCAGACLPCRQTLR